MGGTKSQTIVTEATLYSHYAAQRIRRDNSAAPAQRAADGYIMHEVYGSLAELSFDSTDLVLVEDVSNLLANLLFTEKLAPEAALEQAVRELMQLADNGAEVILVSLCCGLHEGDNDETRQYISALNSLNARLFDLVDEVVELRDGKAHWLKG